MYKNVFLVKFPKIKVSIKLTNHFQELVFWLEIKYIFCLGGNRLMDIEKGICWLNFLARTVPFYSNLVWTNV